VFQSFDTSALDTAPYPLNGAASKPDYLQQRFGATLGGPLVIGKLVNSPRTFFFLNYTGNHSRNPFDEYSTVPSLAERAATCRRLAESFSIRSRTSRSPTTRFRRRASIPRHDRCSICFPRRISRRSTELSHRDHDHQPAG
jgi:hypothetical protein